VSVFDRPLEIDPSRRFTVAAIILFLLGFLPMPLGSMATVAFSTAALAALLLLAIRSVPFEMPAPAGFAVGATLFYFAVDLLSPLLYENRAESWRPIVTSLQFLLFPVLLVVLRTARADPIAVFVRGARIGAIIGGVIAVIQVADGFDRAIGGAVSSFPFGAVAAWLTAVSLLGIGNARWGERIFAAIAFSGGLAAAILSESRGVWLALPVLAVIALVYFRARYGGKVAGTGAAALGAVGLAVLIMAGDSVRERFSETLVMFEGFEFGQADRETSDDEYSLDQRVLMLSYGLEAVVDRPIAGYGLHNAVAEVRARAAEDGYRIDDFNHLHNEYLTETVSNGLIGLTSLLLLLAAPLVVAYRSARDATYPERVALAWFMSAGSATFGLTSLAFGHDITNTVFVSGLLVVCLSAAKAGPRVAADRAPGRSA